MITLVTGKAGSGKSKLAEELAVSFGGRVYYVATMKVMDEAGRLRVNKHRAQREGKGFVTLEQGVDITTILDRIDTPRECVILLECMANLAGNEMYRGDPSGIGEDPSGMSEEELGGLIKRLLEDVIMLGRSVRELIVVTSEYEPQESDDEQTALYKKMLSSINDKLCDIADRVIDTKKEWDK